MLGYLSSERSVEEGRTDWGGAMQSIVCPGHDKSEHPHPYKT